MVVVRHLRRLCVASAPVSQCATPRPTVVHCGVTGNSGVRGVTPRHAQAATSELEDMLNSSISDVTGEWKEWTKDRIGEALRKVPADSCALARIGQGRCSLGQSGQSECFPRL